MASGSAADSVGPVVREELRGSVLELTLNRPKVLNALSFEVLTTLAERLGRAGRDERVRAAIRPCASTIW